MKIPWGLLDIKKLKYNQLEKKMLDRLDKNKILNIVITLNNYNLFIFRRKKRK